MTESAGCLNQIYGHNVVDCSGWVGPSGEAMMLWAVTVGRGTMGVKCGTT